MRIEEVPQLIIEKLEVWFNGLVKMLPNFVVAVLVVVGFWLVARLTRKLMSKGLQKVSDNKSLVRLASKFAYLAIIAVGTFVALSVLHLDKAVTSMLAGIGVIGLALGFAFQDIAANFVAGILMATRKPFRINDLIESKGYHGAVIDINLRSATIRTFDGQDVIIPNKEIFQNPLINYSIYPYRRIDISVGVSYGDDLEKAAKVAINAISSMEMIYDEKPVELFYKAFGGSSIDFSIRYWVDETNQALYLQAQSEGIKAIKKAFEENDISIPFPIRTLDFGIKGGQHLSSEKLHVINQESNN